MIRCSRMTSVRKCSKRELEDEADSLKNVALVDGKDLGSLFVTTDHE